MLTNDLFLLVLDDLIMLVSHELLFLLKVLHNLAQRLLEHLDLALKSLDLLLLILAALVVLVHCAELKHVSTFGLPVLLKQALLLSLAEFESVPLRHRLLGQLLILHVDVLLDVQNV